MKEISGGPIVWCCGVLIGVWCNGELDEDLGGTRVCKDTRKCCEDDPNNNNK